MTEPQPRRRRGWKIVGVFLAAVAVALGALYLWVQATESRRWAGMEAQLVELEKEVVPPPGLRPVLYGKAVPGNAWEDYERALKVLKEQGRLTLLSDYGGGAQIPFSAAERELIRQRLRESAPALEALRQGARREGGRRSVDWRTEARTPMLIYYVAHVAASQARDWVEEGRLHDAVELLLDTVLLSTDLGATADGMGGLISMAMLSHALDLLRDLLSRDGLTREDLLLLDEGLDRLDRSFPDLGPILVNDAMARGWDLHGAESLGSYLTPLYANMQADKPRIPTWRYAFSERLMIVSTFEAGLDAARRLAAAQALPWREASASAQVIDREITDSPNPLRRVSWVWTGNGGSFRTFAVFRGRRAQLRLLRTAAHHRVTGEVLALDDPFGGKLLHSLQEGRLKVWSVGRDGVDDGGSGSWSLWEKDLTLEVRK